MKKQRQELVSKYQFGIAKQQQLINNDSTEINVLKNVERLEMKDDVKTMARRGGLLPQTGSCATFNKAFFLIHKLFVAFYLPVVIAFYDKPNSNMAILDTYVD